MVISSDLAYLYSDFPRLEKSSHLKTSPKDNYYNCIAWAMEDKNQWWWPIYSPYAYWPPNRIRAETIESFSLAFATRGYVRCKNKNHEDGYKKIVLYIDENGLPTHAAREISEKLWTSKMGRGEDISHDFNALEDGDYGKATMFFKAFS